MEDCLFCKFISNEIPVNKIYEDDNMIIIRDIAPKAKNHYLAIIKSHFKYLAEMTVAQTEMLGKIFKTIPELSETLGLSDGYRLVINQGDDAGQSVPHLHIHILCGQKMEWNPA